MVLRTLSLFLGLAVCSSGHLAGGCFPVQSVQGRPAAVLPAGENWSYHGPGGYQGEMTWINNFTGETRKRELPDADVPDYYYYVGRTYGLGKSTEFSCGLAFPFYLPIGMVSVRHQFLGKPYGFDPQQRERRVDASIEAGASLNIVSDIYYGFNLSVPLGRATPYFSFRHHWIWKDYYESVSGDQWSNKQLMFFFGLDFLKPEKRKAIAVELFYGRPPDMTPKRGFRVYEIVGINVIFRALRKKR